MRAGFSLIELLIVLAVMLTIAAIAIPNILKSRMTANEAAAVAALRTITTVQVSYQSTYQQGFANSLVALGPPPGGPPTAAAADLIDSVLASGQKAGYVFLYAAIDVNGDGRPDAFTVNANPVAPGVSGRKFFFVDETNVIRYSLTGPANSASTPIPQ